MSDTAINMESATGRQDQTQERDESTQQRKRTRFASGANSTEEPVPGPSTSTGNLETEFPEVRNEAFDTYRTIQYTLLIPLTFSAK